MSYRHKCLTHNTIKGFTLLEVLIAITITALIGLGTWNLMGGAIRAQETSQTHATQLMLLQKTMHLLERDISQILARSVRNEYGEITPALTNRNALNIVEFTTGGRRNPLEKPVSELQRVYYELNEGTITRVVKASLDDAYADEPLKQALIGGVTEMKVSFLTEQGTWTSSWPPEQVDEQLDVNTVLPRAVKITFDQERYGEISRLLDLPVLPIIKDEASGSEGEAGDGSDNSADGNSEAGNNTSDDTSDQEG